MVSDWTGIGMRLRSAAARRMQGRGGREGAVPAEPQTCRMSFAVLDARGGEIVGEAGEGINASVVRTGGAYTYCVGYPSMITRSETEVLCTAKSAVVAALSARAVEITTGMLGEARVMAREELLRRVDPERANYLSYFVAHDTVGYGPFSILLEDKGNIEEIEVNSPALPISVYTSRYGRCATNLRFADQSAFRQNVNRLAAASEKELSEDSPIIDVQVGDARIHAQIRPYALSGAAASIRVGGEKNVGIDFLVREAAVDTDTLAYLWLAIDAGLNLVIAGAPASGKTTMLGAVAGFIPMGEKVVTVEEDVHELRFSDSFANVISLYGERYNVTIREQVINALRLRPDRIVVGEIRGTEARDVFSGSNVGVPFITTMHSNDDPLGVIKRLMSSPMEIEARSISMLDLSLHMLQTGPSRRRIESVYEYRWLSRAEALEGTEIGGGEAVSVSRLVGSGALAGKALHTSKAIERFCARRGVSARRAARELEERSGYLRDSIARRRPLPSLCELAAEYRSRGVG